MSNLLYQGILGVRHIIPYSVFTETKGPFKYDVIKNPRRALSVAGLYFKKVNEEKKWQSRGGSSPNPC